VSAGEERQAVSAVNRLLAGYLRRARDFYDGLVEEACRRHPEHARELRSCFETLRRVGMVRIAEATREALPPPRNRKPAEGSSEAEKRPLREPSDASPPADSGPASVGRYELLREIGRGGQGVVYLARDRRIGRRIALKVLSAVGPASAAALRRFRREAEIASRLDDPHICTVYDTGTYEEKPYIAMRYVEGESLAARLERERRRSARTGTTTRNTSTARKEVMQMAALAEEVARTLHAAHEAGVTHRDVKPGNIMVTPEERPVILDFGLAGDEGGGHLSLTATGETPGTPAYMSPEQLAGDRSRIGPRTDVWSLGATLYECLTLRRPFSGETPDAVHRSIESTRPRNARRFNRAIPADLAVVLETALARDPDRRYQSALALAEDLRRVRNREPIAAKRIGGPARVIRYVRRAPGRSASIAALLLSSLLLVGMGAYVIANQPEIASERARARAAEAERWLGAGVRALIEGAASEAVLALDRSLALAPDSVEAVAAKAIALERGEGRAASLAHLERHAEVVARSRVLSRWRDALRNGSPAIESRGHEPSEAIGVNEPGLDPRREAADHFIEALRALPEDLSTSDPSQLSAPVRHLRAAVLLLDRPRFPYHETLARVTGGLKDREHASAIAHALAVQWPRAPEAWRAAAAALEAVDAERAARCRARAAALEAAGARPGEGRI